MEIMEKENLNAEARVIKAVCSTLALGPEDVKPESLLVNGLGMDSLDFLDLMFTLEKEFGAKIRMKEIQRALRPDPNLPAQEKEFLTTEEIARLARLMPELAKEGAGRKLRRSEFFSWITVGTLVNMIHDAIESGADDHSPAP